MTTQLNGINYTEMLLTDEELAVVKAMRNKTSGCLKCESKTAIKHGDFNLGIEEDSLWVDFKIDTQSIRHDDSLEVQISYCPFCGKKL